MSLSAKIDSFVHPLLRKRIAKMFNAKLALCKKRRPDLFSPVDPELVRKYKELWAPLGMPVVEDYLRFFCNISGRPDYRYLPEDIFIGRIERILNDCNRATGEAEDKNQYSLFIDPKYQPRFVLRFMRGQFFDDEYNFLTDSQAANILAHDQGDLIGKVSVDSGGGHGIKGFFFANGEYKDKTGFKLTVDWIRANFIGYVLQERISQCDFSAQFNPSSANTCRIITYRCPWDGRTLITKAGMRFGASKEVYDNLSSGGVCVSLGPNGELSPFGRDWYKLHVFTKHPTSGIEFGGLVHPFYRQMEELSCKFAAKMPNFNLISWDMVADREGVVKILEINLTKEGSDWEQYDFGPFFGDLTEKTVEWCVANSKYDSFRHIRPWY